MPSEALFEPLFVPDRLRAGVSGEAWLQAMLDAEAALAAAEARVGVIPADAADAIAAACDAARFDAEALGREGRRPANPVEPLVRALRSAVDGRAADYVHWGATSQDILDTAAMLVARRTTDFVLSELDGLARACARRARENRETLMVARTLLQQALPTTFGLKAANWLAGVLEARRRLLDVRENRLAAQLGGAAGTSAALGADGVKVLAAFAAELSLAEPVLPWHTNRVRVVELGQALDLAAGAAEKIALDVVLLSQTEVGEARERDGGTSSTLPQKRNPTGSVLALACSRHAHAAASLLAGAAAQEHERSAGAWHAEWLALRDVLAFAGAAVSWVRSVVEGLELDAARMRENLAAAGDSVLAERAAVELTPRVGRAEAHELVGAAVGSGRPLRELVPAELTPGSYLGSADAFVDRALEEAHRELGA